MLQRNGILSLLTSTLLNPPMPLKLHLKKAHFYKQHNKWCKFSHHTHTHTHSPHPPPPTPITFHLCAPVWVGVACKEYDNILLLRFLCINFCRSCKVQCANPCWWNTTLLKRPLLLLSKLTLEHPHPATPNSHRHTLSPNWAWKLFTYSQPTSLPGT